jgi:hypothetical protein
VCTLDRTTSHTKVFHPQGFPTPPDELREGVLSPLKSGIDCISQTVPDMGIPYWVLDMANPDADSKRSIQDP